MKHDKDFDEYFEEYDFDNERTFEAKEDAADEEAVEEEKGSSLFEAEYDPIKVYLKEMGGVPLLTKGSETDLAVQIEKGKERLTGVIFSLAFAVEKLVSLGRMVAAGEAALGHIIQNGDEELEEDMDLERKRFHEATLKIRALFQKQNVMERAKKCPSQARFS